MRPHALPVAAVAHVYAESSLVYKLVVTKNRIAVSDKLILKRLDDQNFSLIGFNYLVINGMLSNYSPCKYATLVVASDIIFIYIIKPYFLLACSNIPGKLHLFKDYFVYQVIMIIITIITVDSYFRL